MSILGLSTIPTLVIAALAVFRLAYLITKESGPFFFFWRVRKEAKKQGGSLAEGIQCSYCCQVWASIAITAYLAQLFRCLWLDYIIVILSVAGLAMLFHQVFVKLQK